MNTPNSPHRPPPFYVLVPEYVARQLLFLVFVLILVGEGDGRFRNTMQRFSIQELEREVCSVLAALRVSVMEGIPDI